MKLSILVAHRDSSEGQERERLWRFIAAKFAAELPEAEVVVGTDDGEDPFHKTLAINRAASTATGDIFGIWDSDTWVRPEAVRAGVSLIETNPSIWVRPWHIKLCLNQRATEHVLGLGAGWDGTLEVRPFGRPEGYKTFWAAPPHMFTRALFEDVGGMDDKGFRGWGSEDVAFSSAMTVLHGPATVLRSRAIHLCHPRIGRSGDDLWVGQDESLANKERGGVYQRARKPEEMRALLDSR